MPGATRACVPVSALSHWPVFPVQSSLAAGHLSSWYWVITLLTLVTVLCYLVRMPNVILVVVSVCHCGPCVGPWLTVATVCPRHHPRPGPSLVSGVYLSSAGSQGVHTATSHGVTLTQAGSMVSPCKLHSRILKFITFYLKRIKLNMHMQLSLHNKTKLSIVVDLAILYRCTRMADGWRHGMMYRSTVTGTCCTVHYLSQVCDGWGPSPDIGVTHYYYGQGAWARQHFTGWAGVVMAPVCTLESHSALSSHNGLPTA